MSGIFYNRPMVLRKLFFVLIIIFLFSSLTKNIFDYQKNKQFYKDFRVDYDAEKKKNLTLRTHILKQSDTYELEKTIRDKLNLLKPNEVSIIIPNPTPTPVVVIPTPLSNWQQWWIIFFQ